MLGLSNTLNTSNSKIYSKNVKDVTMNNEQVALYNLYGHLRDYKGDRHPFTSFQKTIFFSLGCLRYSPLFCKGMKLVARGAVNNLLTMFIHICKLLKRKLEFSISRRLVYYSTSTLRDTAHFCDNKHGEDKLDPNWVTGFVDA